MRCRHCQAGLNHVFLDLGYAPPSNAYLSEAELHAPEVTFPLKLYVCDQCWLVQTIDYSRADELFAHDYAYFSSTSQSWLQHAADYADMISKRLNLSQRSFVIEVASNDGYLLKNFLSAGVPCLGIEPTSSTAVVAQELGIPVMQEFFGAQTARHLLQEGKQADLICGNNVYAHVPDINDFTEGLEIALKEGGTITLEFPHLMRLIQHTQFDTVYHEHFSYLSLTSATSIFSKAGLRIYDVQELPTHGGSLRLFGCREADPRPTEPAVSEMLKREEDFGLLDLRLYKDFQGKANTVKNNFLAFLLEQKELGKSVAAYGAAAKGNTLINYAGLKTDIIDFVCDAAPSKQGKFLPGSHIPILPPDQLAARQPDWVVILPWNLSEEIIKQHGNAVTSWGGQFAVAVPKMAILA